MRSRFIFTIGQQVYDPDYQAILDYATMQGYDKPFIRGKRKQNQLLMALKSSGIWDDLDLLYVFATSGDRDFAKINWKNPGTKDATESGSPTFIQDVGFQGGSPAYLNTGWNPANDGVNFTLNEAGVFIYVNNDITAGNIYQFGGNDSADQATAMAVKFTGSGHRYGINSQTVANATSTNSIGFYHARRVAADDMQLYKDGEKVGVTSTQPSVGLAGNNQPIAILGYNANGTVAGHSNAQVGIFGIGASLVGQESDLYDIWNAYFSSL